MKEADIRATYELTRLLMWEIKEKQGYTLAEISETTGLSSKTVEKYPSETIPTVQTVIALIRFYRPEETMQFIAKQCGGLFVLLPEADGEVSKILQGLAEVGTEFSDVVASVSKAISPASDGGSDITKCEAKVLLKEVDELVEKALSLREALVEVSSERNKI